MEYNRHILNYMEDTEYTSMSLHGLLEDLSGKIDYSSNDIGAIRNAIIECSTIKEDDKNVLKTAQNKIRKIANDTETIDNNNDIQNFLQRQDVKIAKVSCTNLFLIFTDKTNFNASIIEKYDYAGAGY